MLAGLLAALASADPAAREDAAAGLERIELGGEGAAQALVEAFHAATVRASKAALVGKALERDESTRAPLARALQRVGPLARAATADLVDGLLHGGPELVDAAVLAIEAIEPVPAAHLLLSYLTQLEPSTRLAAIKALRAVGFVLGPRAAYARVRHEPARAPKLLTALAAHGLPALRDAAQDPAMRPHALAVFGALGPTGSAERAALIAGLSVTDDASRRAAAQSLGAWGEAAAAAVPSLTALLGGPLSAIAAESLGRIGAPACGAIIDLERSLPLLDATSRAAAEQAIDKLRALSEVEGAAPDTVASPVARTQPRSVAQVMTPTPPPVAVVSSLLASFERPFGKGTKPASKPLSRPATSKPTSRKSPSAKTSKPSGKVSKPAAKPAKKTPASKPKKKAR